MFGTYSFYFLSSSARKLIVDPLRPLNSCTFHARASWIAGAREAARGAVAWWQTAATDATRRYKLWWPTEHLSVSRGSRPFTLRWNNSGRASLKRFGSHCLTADQKLHLSVHHQSREREMTKVGENESTTLLPWSQSVAWIDSTPVSYHILVCDGFKWFWSHDKCGAFAAEIKRNGVFSFTFLIHNGDQLMYWYWFQDCML